MAVRINSFEFIVYFSISWLAQIISIPRPIRRGRKRPFLIVFDSFGSHRITAVFHRIVNERTRSDTPFSGRLQQRLTVLQKFSTVSYRAPLYFESYRTVPYRFLIFLYRTVPLLPQAHGIPYRKIPYRQKNFFFSPKFTIMGYVSYTDYFF